MDTCHRHRFSGRRGGSQHAFGGALVIFFWLAVLAGPASAQSTAGDDLEPHHEEVDVQASAPVVDTASPSQDFLPGVPSRALSADSPVSRQPAQSPQEPKHTGFKALVFEAASDFNSFPRRRSTWVILGIGAGAAALAYPEDDNVNDHLIGSAVAGGFFAPGKWIGSVYVQAGTAVGLYVTGRYFLPHTAGEPRTNEVSHLGFDMLRALIVSQALTQGIKVTVRRDRPTGECCAFPSGHASVAFATASVLERHLGYREAWPTFLLATYVATSRLHDNRHFLSDVQFGSALGIASGWTVVGRHGRSNYTSAPVPIRGGVMVTLTGTSKVQNLGSARPRSWSGPSRHIDDMHPPDMLGTLDSPEIFRKP